MTLRITPDEYAALVNRHRGGKTSRGTRGSEERDFQARVIELARLCDWLVYHTHDSRRSEPGWPDLALAKPDYPLILAELKSEKGKLSIPQRGWLEVLSRTTGLETYLWRPSNWDEIMERLQR